MLYKKNAIRAWRPGTAGNCPGAQPPRTGGYSRADFRGASNDGKRQELPRYGRAGCRARRAGTLPSFPGTGAARGAGAEPSASRPWDRAGGSWLLSRHSGLAARLEV